MVLSKHFCFSLLWPISIQDYKKHSGITKNQEQETSFFLAVHSQDPCSVHGFVPCCLFLQGLCQPPCFVAHGLRFSRHVVHHHHRRHHLHHLRHRGPAFHRLPCLTWAKPQWRWPTSTWNGTNIFKLKRFKPRDLWFFNYHPPSYIQTCMCQARNVAHCPHDELIWCQNSLKLQI